PETSRPHHYCLSLHVALAICSEQWLLGWGDGDSGQSSTGDVGAFTPEEGFEVHTGRECATRPGEDNDPQFVGGVQFVHRVGDGRSEEHTSELQSRFDLVCRLL